MITCKLCGEEFETGLKAENHLEEEHSEKEIERWQGKQIAEVYARMYSGKF